MYIYIYMYNNNNNNMFIIICITTQAAKNHEHFAITSQPSKFLI